MTGLSEMRYYSHIFFLVYVMTQKSLQGPIEERIVEIFGARASNCECIPSHLCSSNHRFTEQNCPDSKDVCCAKRYKGCGYQNPVGVLWSRPARIKTAQLGEYPWMIAVLSVEYNNITESSLNVYRCGGALIHPQVVVTAAHCVRNRKKLYKIRAGEWDTQMLQEPYPHQDRLVNRVIIHERHEHRTNDVALLLLELPVDIGESIDVICLPQKDLVPANGTKTSLSSWGKDTISFKYQTILKKLDLPIVDGYTCQGLLKSAKLMENIILDDSQICAGGEKNIGTCQGDDGSPLISLIPGTRDRYQLTGIIGEPTSCGQDQVPGVHANIANLRSWLDEQLINNFFNMSFFQVNN